MGSIFGTLRRDGAPAREADLTSLNEALAHRVANRAWLWVQGSCGLGARLLHIAPSAGLETAPDAETIAPFVIACDARIDNAAALIERFRLGDGIVCDSQLILALYAQLGQACVEHLLGAFAFAIFDRANERLFCARDHFGEKPFSYAVTAERFAFASEPGALVAAGLAPSQIDDDRMADTLLRNPCDPTSTVYRHIRRLPPAHTLIVGKSDFAVARYWQATTANAPNRDDADIARQFRAIFAEAVACRVQSSAPIGAFLSGGLDSSAVVMQARRELARIHPGEALSTFSAIFPDVPKSDEQSWIRIVEDTAGDELASLSPHHMRADIVGPVDYADDLVAALDEPVQTPNLYKIWALAALARESGVGVMLTGHDGDSVISHGLAWLTELAIAEDWDRLSSELTRVADFLDNYQWVKPAIVQSYVLPLLGQYRSRFQWAKMVRLASALRKRFGTSSREIAQAMAPSWLRRLRQRLRGRPGAESVAVTSAFGSSRAFNRRKKQLVSDFAMSVRDSHLKGVNSPLLAESFELFDRIGSRFGIEMRHPFFDKRLVEFCVSLPPDQKIRNGWTRFVLRSALEGILPEPIRWRRDKSNLGHNFSVSLLKDVDVMKAAFRTTPAAFSAYWDGKALELLADGYRTTPKSSDAMTLHLAYTHALWAAHTAAAKIESKKARAGA